MLNVFLFHLQTSQASFYWATTYYHTAHEALAALRPGYTVLSTHVLHMSYAMWNVFFT